ncbi:hypothetical protein B0T17DRAFT_624356 [Bombardia bombarda]|uniref:Uncharacterized protein n=1 Tax=Bombardia bombarda TaxID=252184 RepID=A0AA39XL28_9PEZI|nr:hypothetical protein B0T17DRAFT_624356 [Bombardia bombarda]
MVCLLHTLLRWTFTRSWPSGTRPWRPISIPFSALGVTQQLMHHDGGRAAILGGVQSKPCQDPAIACRLPLYTTMGMGTLKRCVAAAAAADDEHVCVNGLWPSGPVAQWSSANDPVSQCLCQSVQLISVDRRVLLGCWAAGLPILDAKTDVMERGGAGEP